MPILRNKVPGDITYPDYSRISTMLAGGTANRADPLGYSKETARIHKGEMCTFDAAGRLLSVVDELVGAGASNAFSSGTARANNVYNNYFGNPAEGFLFQGAVLPLVQAMNTAYDDGDEVSCLMPGSRILVPAARAGLRPAETFAIAAVEGTDATPEIADATDIGKAVQFPTTTWSNRFQNTFNANNTVLTVARALCAAGRVFEIYGAREGGLPFDTDLAQKKYLTGAGDLVIAELGTV